MAPQGTQRRLAAILATDMVGYSRLIGIDEEGTLARQKAHRKDLIDPMIAAYGGRIVKSTGDGLLVEFPSVVDAVRCAVTVQMAMPDRETQISEDVRIAYRIGINLGDIVIDGDDIFGDGVNVAARLEGLADPGGICISRTVFDQVKGKLNSDFEDFGFQQLKNIADPIQVYRVRMQSEVIPTLVTDAAGNPRHRRWVGLAAVVVLAIAAAGVFYWKPWIPDFEPASIERMAYPLPDMPSVAVLPFDNYSGDAQLEYFASGLTEDLTSAFSRSPWLFVIARNSAATYKGKPMDVKQVAEDLGVRYLLDGSVQKAGDNLRISAQLVDALSGKNLWTDRFDRPARDVFAVQDEITKHVLTELQVELTMGDSARVRSHGTEILDAWLLQLEGYGEMNKWTRESLIRARTLYEAAFQADSNWAWPLAGTALTHWFDAKQGWSDSRDESIRLGFEYAERAIEIDPNGALGQYALGNMYFLTNRSKLGTERQRKAVELAPNDFSMVAGMAMRIKDFGQQKKSIQLFERAIRLSPKHPWWVSFGYGLALHLVGRKEDAVNTYIQAIELGANNARTYARLGAVYADMGQIDEAKVAIEHALRLEPNYSASDYGKAYPLHDPRRDAWYRDLLLRAGLPKHAPLALPDKPSVAVLPFDNLSDDQEQEYFADGLTDDLITDLSKVSGLFVIARNSVFTFKGKAVRITQVAQELGVRYVVEGSVRRSGDRIRVNAQLIEGSTGHHVWAERYDREITDLFAVQDELIGRIVSALAVRLTRTEQLQLTHRPAPELEAYELYLKAREGYFSREQSRMRESLALFVGATDIDPTFARAYAGLAQLAADMWRLSSVQGLASGVAKKTAEDAAGRALDLDPTLPDAHSVLALLRLAEGDHDSALRSAQRAIELDPNSADAHTTLAIVLGYAGQPDAALESIRTAVRLNPRPPPHLTTYYGWALFLNHRYDEAIAVLEPIAGTKVRGLADAPREILAMAYAESGLLDQARAQVEYLLEQEIFPNLAWYRSAYNYHAHEEDLQRRLDALRKAGVPDWPLGFHGDAELRLTGIALQDLITGRTWSGTDAAREGRFMQEFGTNGGVVYAGPGSLLTGKAFIRGEELCEQFEGFTRGLEFCGPVYRNSGSRPGDNDKYVYVNPLTVRYFSLAQ